MTVAKKVDQTRFLIKFAASDPIIAAILGMIGCVRASRKACIKLCPLHAE